MVILGYYELIYLCPSIKSEYNIRSRVSLRPTGLKFNKASPSYSSSKEVILSSRFAPISYAQHW